MLASARPVAAQGGLQDYDPLRVSIRPISFNPLTESAIVPGTSSWAVDLPSTLGADYFLMNLEAGALPPTLGDDMGELGATVVGLYPPRSYAVRLPPASEQDVDDLAPVRWIDPYLAGHKVPPEAKEAASAPSGDLSLELVFFEGEDPEDYVAELPALVAGLTVGEVYDYDPAGSRSNGTVIVTFPLPASPDALQNLARLEALETMDVWTPVGPANDDKLTWLQIGDFVARPTDLDTFAPAYVAGVSGIGETVAIADSGVRNDSCYFNWDGNPFQGVKLLPPAVDATTVDPTKKVVAYYWHHDDQAFDGSGCGWNIHGTHVAGAAVGDRPNNILQTPNPASFAPQDNLGSDQITPNAPFGTNIDHHQVGDGMAAGAQLLVQDIVNQATCEVADSIPQLFQQAYFTSESHPAGTIQVRHWSASWGSNPAPAGGWPYTERAKDTDEFAWKHRDFNVYFCAGNSGSSPKRIWNGGQAKNCVTVGNTGNPNAVPDRWAMSISSSHGPAVGDRIKPDLSAPGSTTASASGAQECDTTIKSGTSMSTPSVAGMSALIRQYIREGRFPDGVPTAGRGFSPTSALVKALLVNSTRDVWDGVAGHGTCTGDGAAAGFRPSVGQGWGHPVLDDILNFGSPLDVRPNPNPPTGTPEPKLERSNLLILTDTPNGLVPPSAGTWLNITDNRPVALPTLHPAIKEGEVQDYYFEVTSNNTEALHLTLAWTDWRASANAPVPIVNDLDIEVVDPAGRVWRPEPGIPGQPTPVRQWDNSYSKLPTSMTPQSAPFTDFEARDERNNIENIFVRPAHAMKGVWRARVIFFRTALLSHPVTVFPSLVPENPPCIVTVAAGGGNPGVQVPCDQVDALNQGYALVASGAVGFPPYSLFDGCDPSPRNGLLDKQELVNLYLPFTAPVDMYNVIGCLSAVCPGPSCDERIQIGAFAPDLGDATPTNCSVFGHVLAGQTREARFAIKLEDDHPPGAALLRLDVSSSTPGPEPAPPFPCQGIALNTSRELAVPHTNVSLGQPFSNPTPNQPGKGGCGGPPPVADAEDPSYTLVDGDSDGMVDDLFIQFCPGNTITSALKFNIYRGRGFCPQLEKNHVAGWCSIECNDGGFPSIDPPLSTPDGRCEVLQLNGQGELASPFYDVISAEKDCAVAGRGAEGAFEVCATQGCKETPYGGGCP